MILAKVEFIYFFQLRQVFALKETHTCPHIHSDLNKVCGQARRPSKCCQITMYTFLCSKNKSYFGIVNLVTSISDYIYLNYNLFYVILSTTP